MKKQTGRKGTSFEWTHASVLELNAIDPISYICSEANKLVLEAMQQGWKGPPFDPAQLAELTGIRVTPREEVGEARIVPLAGEKLQIEYNPNKPRARVRYSIAHELAHTLFPDCREQVRYRAASEDQVGDDWQLEMLCNLAAAEFLMPVTSFPELRNEKLTIDRILELRKQFEVSTEAVLLKTARVASSPVAIFTASRKTDMTGVARYQVDYCVGSRNWPLKIAAGTVLPKDTLLADCTAIGFTVKGSEVWEGENALQIEAVGIPPFPGDLYPRIAGVMHSKTHVPIEAASVSKVIGDALTPRGSGVKIVAHIVNDKTPNWGAGFALEVRKKWPEVQNSFRSHIFRNPKLLHLGNCFQTRAEKDVFVFQMIAQHGYGESSTPRLRYSALNECLKNLALFAQEKVATVHMPRIGVGYGGGVWELVEQMIDQTLCSQGIPVTVYNLKPDENIGIKAQPSLFSMT